MHFVLFRFSGQWERELLYPKSFLKSVWCYCFDTWKESGIYLFCFKLHSNLYSMNRHLIIRIDKPSLSHFSPSVFLGGDRTPAIALFVVSTDLWWSLFFWHEPGIRFLCLPDVGNTFQNSCGSLAAPLGWRLEGISPTLSPKGGGVET